MLEGAKLTVTQIMPLIRQCLLNFKALGVYGKPGIGKTSVFLQIAAELGYDTIVSHPVVADPTDFKGLPDFDREHEMAKWFPYGDLYKACHTVNPLLWIFDDMLHGPQSVQAVIMQLIWGRSINGLEISPFTTFALLTNSKEDKAGSGTIIEPLKSRPVTFVEMVPDEEAFYEYWIRNNLDGRVLGFLRNIRPELISDFKPTSDFSNSPIPRTWEHVHDLLQFDLEMETLYHCLVGAIGEGAAKEFYGHLKRANSINLDSILLNPAKAPIPNETDLMYAVAAGLGGKATMGNFGKFMDYAERLENEGRAEFAMIMVKDAIRRKTELLAHPRGIAMCNGNSQLAQLFKSVN